MEREERQRVKGVTEDVNGWSKRAVKLAEVRQHITNDQAKATDIFTAALRPCASGHEILWRTLSLNPGDGDLVTAIARGNLMPAYSPDLTFAIDELTGDRVAQALHDAKSVVGARRIFSGRDKKDAGAKAGEWLAGFHSRLSSSGLISELERLESWDEKSVSPLGTSSILTESVGLVPALGRGAELLERHEIASAAKSITAIDRALEREGEFRSVVTSAGNAVRQAEARKLVTEMPVERLKDATNGRLNIKALTDAGITNVQQVLDQSGRIFALPRVGETIGNRMAGAAQTIWQTTVDEMPVRIDIKNRTSTTTRLLKAMRAWDAARSIKSATSDLEAADSLRPVVSSLGATVSHIVVVPERRSLTDLRTAIAAVNQRASLLTGGGSSADGDPWDDFIARPADYYAMLSELGFLPDDDEKSQGDLAVEIVEAIRDLKLETSTSRPRSADTSHSVRVLRSCSAK